MNIWVTIITALGGGATIWGAIWAVVNWRARKRKEVATADDAQAQVVAQFQKAAHQELSFVNEWMQTSKEKFNTMEDKIDSLQKQVSILNITINKKDMMLDHIKFYYCNEMNCLHRNPPMGQFDENNYSVLSDQIHTPTQKNK